MYLKDEVCRLLDRSLNEETSCDDLNSPSKRYVDALWMLLKKENHTKKLDFIRLYITMLNHTNLDVLKVNFVVTLYNKWINHPRVFEDIDLIIKRIRLKNIDQEFLLLVVENSMLDKPNRTLHIARLYLLIHGINAGMINEKELISSGLLIKAILTLTINSNDQTLLIKRFNSVPNHYYRYMFFLVRSLLDNKVDKLSLSEIIRIHFSQTGNSLEWNAHTKQFFEVLVKIFSNDILLYLKNYEIKKIYFLYSYQPILFERLRIEGLRELNIKNVVDVLFQNFMFPRSLLYSFVFDKLSIQERKWFEFELTNNNIVNAENLPFKLTKNAAHVFRCMNEDVGLSVTRTLVYAQIFSIIENKPFAIAVAHCIRNFADSSYWIDNMVLLYKKGLASGDVREIMDYINEIVFIQRTPLVLKNKSLENLFRDIEQWHRNLSLQNFEKTLAKKKLPSAHIPEFKIYFNNTFYKIVQLKKLGELFIEGSNLKHCVFSYKNYCLKKESYIFSLMQINVDTSFTSLVTIELNSNKKIIQARGKFNRDATADELMIIQSWAKENSLLISI